MASCTSGNILYILIIIIYNILLVVIENDFYVITERNIMYRIPAHKPRSFNIGQSQTDFDSDLSYIY